MSRTRNDIIAENALLHEAYKAEEAGLLGKQFIVQPFPATHAWHAFMLESGGGINPSFTPGPALTPENSFCLVCHDATATNVAGIALRIYDTSDVRELLVNGRLWLPAHKAVGQQFEFVLPDSFPKISGRVAHIGGLFVRDEWRGAKVGSHLDMMIRIAAVELFEAEHIIATRKADKIVTMPAYYNAARAALALKDVAIIDPCDAYLTHISRGELISRLADRGDDNLVNLSDFVGSGYS